MLCVVGTERDQNIPAPNTPLWHKDYFKLKENEKQKTQEELSVLSLSAQKQGIFLFFLSSFKRIGKLKKAFSCSSGQLPASCFCTRIVCGCDSSAARLVGFRGGGGSRGAGPSLGAVSERVRRPPSQEETKGRAGKHSAPQDFRPRSFPRLSRPRGAAGRQWAGPHSGAWPTEP